MLLVLAHQRSLEQGHMLMHSIMFTSIMGCQGGQWREWDCHGRVAMLDPWNKLNGPFVYTFLNLEIDMQLAFY